MPKFAANLTMLFNEVPFMERFDKAAAANFKAVEFLFPYAFPAADIKAKLDQNKLTLGMLADHVETYVQCSIGIKKAGIVTKFNNGNNIGTSPFLTVRNKTTTLIIQLMNELGLTPRGRLSINKPDDTSSISKFLRGAKG